MGGGFFDVDSVCHTSGFLAWMDGNVGLSSRGSALHSVPRKSRPDRRPASDRRLAFEFRQRFHKNVVIDVVLREWGHNEGDDPSFT
jgi:hypothetical protein